MLIYEYKSERDSGRLFLRTSRIVTTEMPDDQVIIYYPRKMVDIPSTNIACLFSTQMRTKFFRDRFMDELDRYLTTISVGSKIIKSYKQFDVVMHNGSSIRFRTQNGPSNHFRGLSLTHIITDEYVNVKNLDRLREIR